MTPKPGRQSARSMLAPLSRACEGCGAPFTASRPDRRFCSNRCRAANTRAGRLRQWLQIRDQLDRLMGTTAGTRRPAREEGDV
jgi:endogenous inhibitor of DNA gyrase (YacG/DUF329 family)